MMKKDSFIKVPGTGDFLLETTEELTNDAVQYAAVLAGRPLDHATVTLDPRPLGVKTLVNAELCFPTGDTRALAHEIIEPLIPALDSDAIKFCHRDTDGGVAYFSIALNAFGISVSADDMGERSFTVTMELFFMGVALKGKE